MTTTQHPTLAKGRASSFPPKRRAIALLQRTEAGHRPVRLLGVSVHNLRDPYQTDEDPEQPSLPFE